MARFHTKVVRDKDGNQTGQENIPFTAKEETDRDAEERATADAKPLFDWKEAIAATDEEMPRFFEDYLEKIGPPADGRVRDNYDAKKLLRSQQP